MMQGASWTVMIQQTLHTDYVLYSVRSHKLKIFSRPRWPSRRTHFPAINSHVRTTTDLTSPRVSSTWLSTSWPTL